jgi:hypothetical protein
MSSLKNPRPLGLGSVNSLGHPMCLFVFHSTLGNRGLIMLEFLLVVIAVTCFGILSELGRIREALDKANEREDLRDVLHPRKY